MIKILSNTLIKIGSNIKIPVRTMTQSAKVWTAKHKVVGSPTLGDFQLIEEDLPKCQDGGNK